MKSNVVVLLLACCMAAATGCACRGTCCGGPSCGQAVSCGCQSGWASSCPAIQPGRPYAHLWQEYRGSEIEHDIYGKQWSPQQYASGWTPLFSGKLVIEHQPPPAPQIAMQPSQPASGVRIVHEQTNVALEPVPVEVEEVVLTGSDGTSRSSEGNGKLKPAPVIEVTPAPIPAARPTSAKAKKSGPVQKGPSPNDKRA